jgi:hypothetical protein
MTFYHFGTKVKSKGEEIRLSNLVVLAIDPFDRIQNWLMLNDIGAVEDLSV